MGEVPVQTDDMAQFVAVRYADLLRTAYLLTGSLHTAEDLVQTCLLKVMPRWDTIDDHLAYLRRALVNQRTSRWRRLWRETVSDRPPDPGVPDPAAGLTDRTALVAELARLPKQMRSVLVLRYWEDLSEAETADVLGCSIGSVKSQASRGIARLRSVLADAPTSADSRSTR
jgi:RNA polymerase sigma-70 factor (sigma-E family)